MASPFANRRAPAPTVTMEAPSTGQRSAPHLQVVTEFRTEVSEAMQGRLSLLLLNTLVVSMLAFYWWTRNAQGGG